MPLKESQKLRDCPFCGSGAIEVSAWEDHTTIGCLDCDYGIRCQDCDEEDAVDWWNTRPVEDSLSEDVLWLKAVIAEIGAKVCMENEETADAVFTLCKNAVGEKLIMNVYKEEIRKIAEKIGMENKK